MDDDYSLHLPTGPYLGNAGPEFFLRFARSDDCVIGARSTSGVGLSALKVFSTTFLTRATTDLDWRWLATGWLATFIRSHGCCRIKCALIRLAGSTCSMLVMSLELTGCGMVNAWHRRCRGGDCGKERGGKEKKKDNAYPLASIEMVLQTPALKSTLPWKRIQKRVRWQGEEKRYSHPAAGLPPS